MTLSTTGVKYVALEGTVKRLLFLCYVWRLMLPEKDLPCFSVFGDNQGAVKLARNQ